MSNLTRAYWSKTHILWCSVLAYSYVSWEVASWYTRASTSAFVWLLRYFCLFIPHKAALFVLLLVFLLYRPPLASNLTRNYSSPFSVTQDGQEYECLPQIRSFCTHAALKHVYLSLMVPFLGITLICLLKDVFSVELFQFLQSCSRGVQQFFIIDSKKEVTTKQDVFVESEVQPQSVTESSTTVEENHALLTTLLRIFSTVVAHYVIIYSLWLSFTESEPSERYFSEVNLMDELVPISGTGTELISALLLPFILFLMICVQVCALAIVLKSEAEATSTSDDDGYCNRAHFVITHFQRYRTVVERCCRILILYSLHVVILVLTIIAFETSIGFGFYKMFQNERSPFTAFAVVCSPSGSLHLRWISPLLLIMCPLQFIWLYQILRIRTGHDINELSEHMEEVELEVRAEIQKAQPPQSELIPKRWKNPHNVVRKYDPVLNTFEFHVRRY